MPQKIKLWYVALIAALLVAMLLGAGLGALSIAPGEIFRILGSRLGGENAVSLTNEEKVHEAVLLAIRLPRVCLAVLVGASLAIAGAAMQGLFRNPLADPGLIGISSGASVSAVAFIVLSGRLLGGLSGVAGVYSLSVITFLGALASAVIVYRLSQAGGKTIVTMMLLAGIGINAIALSGTGFFTYTATDSQLRSIAFWTLGSLGGANWTVVTGILPFTILALILLPLMGKSLNAFALNETNAAHLGVRTERVKTTVILLSALCVGASVAVSGVIAFVGLIVPHIIRLISGPDHRYLLPLSALGGAILLLVADLIARTAFGNTELPIGVLTSLIGGPFFLFLLLRERRFNLGM